MKKIVDPLGVTAQSRRSGVSHPPWYSPLASTSPISAENTLATMSSLCAEISLQSSSESERRLKRSGLHLQPSVLAGVWTLEMTSRARPSSFSSWVMRVSSSTVTRASPLGTAPSLALLDDEHMFECDGFLRCSAEPLPAMQRCRMLPAVRWRNHGLHGSSIRPSTLVALTLRFTSSMGSSIQLTVLTFNSSPPSVELPHAGTATGGRNLDARGSDGDRFVHAGCDPGCRWHDTAITASKSSFTKDSSAMGKALQMHRVFRTIALAGLEPLVQNIGHKGQSGCEQSAEQAEHFVQGFEGV